MIFWVGIIVIPKPTNGKISIRSLESTIKKLYMCPKGFTLDKDKSVIKGITNKNDLLELKIYYKKIIL